MVGVRFVVVVLVYFGGCVFRCVGYVGYGVEFVFYCSGSGCGVGVVVVIFGGGRCLYCYVVY